jgi:hypothetical protein
MRETGTDFVNKMTYASSPNHYDPARWGSMYATEQS